jgi:hypothetical protein
VVVVGALVVEVAGVVTGGAVVAAGVVEDVGEPQPGTRSKQIRIKITGTHNLFIGNLLDTFILFISDIVLLCSLTGYPMLGYFIFVNQAVGIVGKSI